MSYKTLSSLENPRQTPHIVPRVHYQLYLRLGSVWGISVGVPERITAYRFQAKFLVLDCDFLLFSAKWCDLPSPEPTLQYGFQGCARISNIMYIFMLSY